MGVVNLKVDRGITYVEQCPYMGMKSIFDQIWCISTFKRSHMHRKKSHIYHSAKFGSSRWNSISVHDISCSLPYLKYLQSRGKWGKANYLRKDLDLCFTGFCFLSVITTKGKFRISALIFLWTTFHCICYKLEKFNIEENKIRFGILKIAGQSGPLLVHAAPCDQKIIIFPNNIVFIAQKHAAYVTTTANQLC